MTYVFRPSARELKLLYGYSKGMKDKEIAVLLGVKPSYVGVLGARMRQRIGGAVDRAHAVAIAYDIGVLPLDGAP